MKRITALLAAVGIVLCLQTTLVQAEPCTSADFASAIDKSGASLRAFTLEAQPKLQEGMRRYSEVKKLAASEYEDAALDAIQDSKLMALNEKSAAMLMRIDSLGRVAEGTAPDCAKLDEIKTMSRDLLAVMVEKSDYMLARIDAKIAEAGGAKVAAKLPAAEPVKTVEDKPKSEKPIQEKAEPPKAKAVDAKPVEPAKPKANDAFVPPPPPVAANVPPVVVAQVEDGYTIDEIRDATRGFFGTISTNLASVIEHAFKTTGRPTAYVLGTEGGGAFFAGLRFGQGTLFMRNLSGTRPVYWHGPSLGTDFGASGSRTMFLIYKLQQPDALFRSFTGVDGSAYFVGGVGVTLLKGGDVIMAPIRSGIGLRLGANIGYVRFSDKPTWNPF